MLNDTWPNPRLGYGTEISSWSALFLGATLAADLESQRWTLICILKRPKAAGSCTKWEDEMKRGGRLYWDERQEQWQSGEENLWINFHSLVSRKSRFWHMHYAPWLTSPSGILAGMMTGFPCEKTVTLTYPSLDAAWAGAREDREGDMMRY